MGLLPEIAKDLLPTLYAQSTSKAVAHAGWMITAYALGVVVGAPTTTGPPRRQLRAFRSPQVWLVAAVASIGFGGLFAIDSYIAPITTHVAGLSAATVPWVLVAVGLGMTVGNLAGGWASDRDL